MLLTGEQIKNMANVESNNSLVITPILDENQIGIASVDLRLGNNFKSEVKIRKPIIEVTDENIDSFFDETYRDFGQKFILYPNQLVLCNSFEYIRLPNNIIGFVYTRSSLNRLGIQLSTIVQPGYAGSLTLEFINKGNNAVSLIAGMRVAQLILFKIEDGIDSFEQINITKYIGNIEPIVSQINKDKDLEVLKKMMI
jgi:dCTP deaminase